MAVIGGGHNGLTAAAYLARAGKRVVVLERLDDMGGAAVSEQAFPGVDARLSRYSYLVSLLPRRIVDDLGLRIQLARRRYSSYTPVPGGDRGLLIDAEDPDRTATSFRIIGAEADAQPWSAFYRGTGRVASGLFPTLTEPLPTRAEARRAVGEERAWRDLVERPVGESIRERFGSDLVRGVVLTDALIGTFAPDIDPSLAANRCFLYHVIGGGTGDWDVPIGGMGAVTAELRRAAIEAGAELATGAEVLRVTPDGELRFAHGEGEWMLWTDRVLANCSPQELARLLDEELPPPAEGAQVKVNLVLSRLPRLRDPGIDPRAAFGGTFHINETWSQLDAAHRAASEGHLPDPIPCEIYCHSLTDPSILGPELAASGAQTMTVFALHVPDRLLAGRDGVQARRELEEAVLASLDSVLAEPIRDVVLTDAEGRPCIETRTTRDLESALRLPGGNIFHGPLAWPWAEEDEALVTPAERWGVATAHPRILLCGAGARRGGGVSGIGGQNAAMALLEE